jgi:hypothetical protein
MDVVGGIIEREAADEEAELLNGAGWGGASNKASFGLGRRCPDTEEDPANADAAPCANT